MSEPRGCTEHVGPITLETLEHQIVAPLFEWWGTWLVMDADTGACKRHWGANGRPPASPASSSSTTSTAYASHTTAFSTSATAAQPHPGLPEGRGVGEGNRCWPETHGIGSTWDVNAVDSEGTLYAAGVETGKRVQKFVRARSLRWLYIARASAWMSRGILWK